MSAQAGSGTETASTDQAGEWAAWVGRTEETTEEISAQRVAALAATLDLDEMPQTGTALPPGWHWLFFNPSVRRRELGPDGHPRRGGFLPPIPLPRRMWAGGRLDYIHTAPIGSLAKRRSEIVKVEIKSGRRGQLVFVTVRHIISVDGSDCINEEQDIVYREASPPGTATPAPELAPTDAEHEREIRPDPVLLFRYSALTFNGHRIHYDPRYAQQEEGYRDLVVHGPLTATLLQNFGASLTGAAGRLSRFEFRGVNPLFVDRPFLLCARHASGDTMTLWATGPQSELAMTAKGFFAA